MLTPDPIVAAADDLLGPWPGRTEVRIAPARLVRWLAADFGFEEIDAYMLLTQCGRVRLGNMVDPKYTVGASILKKYLV